LFFQSSLGIDIQERAIAIAYLRASFKGAKLAAHGLYPIEDGLSIQERAALLGRVVKEFLGRNKISSTPLFLGLPRGTAIFRYVELPLVVKENLKESLQYELEKYVPFPPDELYFDYQVISEDKKEGKLRLLLLTVKREAIDPFISLTHSSGITFFGIEVCSTAVANFFAVVAGSDEQIPYGLIYAWQGGLEIDLLDSGFLVYSRLIEEAQWGADFHNQVSKTLKGIVEGLKDQEGPFKIVSWNLGTENALMAHLEDEEAFDVRFFDPSSAEAPSNDVIAAYGLALKGLQEVPTNINLLPEKMRKKAGRAVYYTMVALASLVIFLALAWIGGTIYNTQHYIGRLDAEVARLKVEATKLERIKEDAGKIEHQVELLEPLRRNSLMLLDAIKELSETIPKSAWLLRLTYSDKDGKIQIEGWADSASELIPLLDNSPLLSGVGFLSSITRSHAGKERFRIGLELERQPVFGLPQN
jgi:Tfp pilus assembly protein PilN